MDLLRHPSAWNLSVARRHDITVSRWNTDGRTAGSSSSNGREADPASGSLWCNLRGTASLTGDRMMIDSLDCWSRTADESRGSRCVQQWIEKRMFAAASCPTVDLLTVSNQSMSSQELVGWMTSLTKKYSIFSESWRRAGGEGVFTTAPARRQSATAVVTELGQFNATDQQTDRRTFKMDELYSSSMRTHTVDQLGQATWDYGQREQHPDVKCREHRPTRGPANED